MSEKENENVNAEMWAVVELMGHEVTAGIVKPGELGGLIRIDVPIDDGFRTEFLGEKAIFRIKVVSEEIARAYALPDRNIIAYDEPIVPRAQYEEALQIARRKNNALQRQVSELENRLTAVKALPSGDAEDWRDFDDTLDDDGAGW